jgi:hypothetical protein
MNVMLRSERSAIYRLVKEGINYRFAHPLIISDDKSHPKYGTRFVYACILEQISLGTGWNVLTCV